MDSSKTIPQKQLNVYTGLLDDVHKAITPGDSRWDDALFALEAQETWSDDFHLGFFFGLLPSWPRLTGGERQRERMAGPAEYCRYMLEMTKLETVDLFRSVEEMTAANFRTQDLWNAGGRNIARSADHLSPFSSEPPIRAPVVLDATNFGKGEKERPLLALAPRILQYPGSPDQSLGMSVWKAVKAREKEMLASGELVREGVLNVRNGDFERAEREWRRHQENRNTPPDEIDRMEARLRRTAFLPAV